MIQVIDGLVVTIYSWTNPKKGLVWCLASANGFDVSNLKWGGDKTYAEVLFEPLAKSQPFLSATGLRLRRGLLCVDNVRLDFQPLDRGRCYTIGFHHPNFHPMAPTLRGSGISSRLTLRRGSPRRLAFQASFVKQLTIVKISFVRLVVKTSDVVVYGWKTLSTYRGELLTMKRLPSPASPCPGSWPAASGSSTPHLITVLSSALTGQKSVQTSCMRRHYSIVSDSSSTVAAHHNKYSRRGTSIIALGPFSVLQLGATFMSSFLSLCPSLQCMKGLSIISSTS